MIDYFYDVLKDEKFARHTIPIESKNYFYKYLKRIEKIGLPHGLLHGSRGKPSHNLKLTLTMKELIIYLKSYGNFTSCRDISDNLKELKKDHKEIECIDESTIRNYLATHESDNLTLLARQGYRSFEAKILGYLPLNRTKDPLSKIIIDGYVTQVKCEGESLSPIKLLIFAIMDSFSGYVVIEIGEVEDYNLIRRTFEKFLSFTGYKMPMEVVSDGHTSSQSRYFETFRKYLKDNKVTWVVTPNPRRKSQLERWFGTLQQIYLTKIVGYVGEGIKSRRKDAHPSEEVLMIVKSREYLKNRNELIRLLYSAVDDYNTNAHFKDAASPLDLYHLKKPINFIQLQDFHLPYFFWDKHEVSIHGSMIILRRTIADKVKRWFYRKAEFDFSLLNGSQVDVYHKPEEDQFVYLFERKSMKFICKVDKHLAANEAITDQSDADRKIIADFGISKVKLHDAYINRLEEIETNLKEKFGIDPRELRGKAEFKKREDEYEGYELGLATRTREPDISKPYKYRRGRRAVKGQSRKTKKANSNLIRDTLG